MEGHTVDEQVLIVLRQIIRAIDLYSKKISKKFGLTAPQLIVLKSIHELQSPSLKGIAKSVTLSSATVSTILDRLISKNLVTRSRSGGDKRQSELKLTEEGSQVLQNAPTVLQDTFVKKFNQLEVWEQNLILSSIQRVASMMNADEIESMEDSESFTVFVSSPLDS